MAKWGKIKCPSCDEQDALWEGMERSLEESDAREARLEARIEELESENHLLKTSGIIEVAVRNPNVMEYMWHWEGRAEAAEAKLAKAMEVLSAIDQYGSDTLSGRADGPDDRSWQREGVLEMTRRARTTLAELKGQGDAVLHGD